MRDDHLAAEHPFQLVPWTNPMKKRQDEVRGRGVEGFRWISVKGVYELLEKSLGDDTLRRPERSNECPHGNPPTRPRLQLGEFTKGTLHFDDGRFAVGVLVDTADPSRPFMELIHTTRDDREGDRIVRDRIRLLWTSPTFGGRRWWFQCPRTGRRTTKLFLPNGGRHFWSRQAYGLGYACQREGSFDRLQRRAAMLNRQLGGKGWATWESPPPKPKWMRWQTYERKYERWEQIVERANAEFALKAMRLLKRPMR